MTEPIIIEGLTKNYDSFRALDSLDLKVQKKSFVGFLGPNGAGKTTTIKILTSMLRATTGRAFLNGVDVTEDPKEALAGVGAVVETPEFYPYLTPVETLHYLGSLRGMTHEEIDSRGDELLTLVKMDEWKDQRIGTFSKGMKQRLAIAQALLHRPTVVILDEPTSGLDPRGMVEVRNILKDLRKEDFTIFMSSHLLNEVQEICDYVALIDHGRLLSHGSVEDLTRVSESRRLVITLLDPVDQAIVDKVSSIEGVKEAKKVGSNKVTLIYGGSEVGQAILLKDLLAMGLRVIGFQEEGLALETLYMDLIKDSR